MNFWDLDHPNNSPALIDEAAGRHWSYGELKHAAEMLSAKLGRGNRKQLGFIMCSNSLECIAAYLGALQSNATAALFAADLSAGFLAHLLTVYRPDWVFATASMERHADYNVIGTIGAFNLWGSGRSEQREISPELGLLLSTSGTTGTPKLVRLSHLNLQANASSIRQFLELDELERPVTSLPMAYSYGLSVINSHLLAGATILLTNQSVMQRDFWNFVGKEHATSFAGVPYTYKMLLRAGLMDRDLPVETWTQAGGRLEPKYIEQIHRIVAARGGRFFVMYGQTEATARISYVPPEHLANNMGAIGVPIPGGQMRVDPKSGELLYYGPNVMMGYAQNVQDLSKGHELFGELHTGDLARQNENGFFQITGRKARFLKILGLRLSLDDVETALGLHFDSPLACFGTDDILQIAVEDGTLMEPVLRVCCDLFKLHRSVVRVSHVGRLPQTSNDKTDYNALVALASSSAKPAAAGQ